MTGVLAALAGSAGGAATPLSVSASTASGQLPFAPGVPGVAATAIGPDTAVSGGTAPYTYAWTYVSGNAAISIDDATALNPVWSRTFTSFGSTSATWRITVTDAASNTATADILVFLEATP